MASGQEIQRDYANGLIPNPYFERCLPASDSPDWLVLGQHYEYQTRLLDVTKNVLVALYFAVERHDDADGVIRLAYPGSYNEWRHDDNAQSVYDLFSVTEVPSRTRPREAYYPQARTPFLWSPLVTNENMAAQYGQFLWWRAPEAINPQGPPIRVAAAAKAEIRDHLARLGVTEEVLFPNGRPASRPP